jgi:hypothetical protein
MNAVWQAVKSAWSAWTRLARQIGNFQARVILTFLYAALVLPFGMIVRLFSRAMSSQPLPLSVA